MYSHKRAERILPTTPRGHRDTTSQVFFNDFQPIFNVFWEYIQSRLAELVISFVYFVTGNCSESS